MRSEMQDMSRIHIYNDIKVQFQLETYVKHITDRKLRSLLAKARMGTLPIQIETGRYRGIPKEERLCQHCDLRVIEDEMHLLLYCSKYKDLRKGFYETILPNADITAIPDIELVKFMIANDDVNVMFLAAKYLRNALTKRSAP